MTFPIPRPGEVIRYRYLWADEADAGRDEGSKDRPCAVVLALSRSGEEVELIVVPITHAQPADPTAALEIPPRVKLHLGLDDERSWIVFTEANRFVWPGPDISPFARNQQTTVSHGYLPPKFFRELAVRMLERDREEARRYVARSS